MGETTSGASEKSAASWVVDDYSQGLRVERALATLEAIPDPITRVHAADGLADQAREVQSDIAKIRRRAIYEATLRPGHTGESVAAELGISPKAVSSAVAISRAKDRALFRNALEILNREGVTKAPRDQLAGGLNARDVLVQARLVATTALEFDLDAVNNDEYALIEEARSRAEAIHRVIGEQTPRPRWHAPKFSERHFDPDEVPGRMHLMAQVFSVLPGIMPLFFESPTTEPDAQTSLWRIAWSIKPAEEGATVFDAGPHRDGWAMTEYLIWLIRDLGRDKTAIWSYVTSPPPFLNQPGEGLTFVVEGDAQGDKPITPEEFVRWLRQCWVGHETGFTEIAWPDGLVSSNDEEAGGK